MRLLATLFVLLFILMLGAGMGYSVAVFTGVISDPLALLPSSLESTTDAPAEVRGIGTGDSPPADVSATQSAPIAAPTATTAAAATATTPAPDPTAVPTPQPCLQAIAGYSHRCTHTHHHSHTYPRTYCHSNCYSQAHAHCCLWTTGCRKCRRVVLDNRRD